jgi:sugar lactone lactonase YvrE
VLLLFKGKKMAVSKVVVVDGNNLIVRIDRGVAGRGVTDVEPVEIDNAMYLEFTFSDGTTETVGPVGVIQYVGTAPIVVSGANISLSTVPVNLGGTNATTAANARTNLNAANQDTTITAGTGLSGGGSLAANRTINIANTAVTAGAYGSASNTLSATVNAQGQLTALAATPIAIANTQVSGLGTASVLNAGVALGVATLDAGGTVPLSQIPASIQGGVSYQGSWNASTNTPTLTSSVGSKGYYYVVSVAGSTNLNGITDWLPGDWAIFNGSVWEQIDNTDTVQSVNGYVGAVVLNAADVGAPPTTRSISTGTGLTGGGNLSADRTIAIDSTVATLTGTQTLTNKTINLASNTLQATSAEIAAAVTDETGTGALVFGTAPVFGGKTGFGTAAAAATVHVAGNTILSNVNVIGASYDSVSFSVAAEEISPSDLFFRPDGLKMYIVGTTGDDVNEYNLSTAWVVSSAVFATNFSVASQDSTPTGLFFRADGTKMYIVGQTTDTVFQYTLSTPWSIATASYESISFSVAGQDATPNGITFRPNGLSMYVVGATNDNVYQYTLSTAWNVSTATFLQSLSVAGQESIPNAVTFTGDGSRMFVMGQGGDDVNVYNLTTPWDISTSAFVNVFSVAGQDVSPQGIYIKPDGTKMYMVGSTNDAVFQYTVPSIDIQLTGPTSVAALDVQQDLTVYGNTTGSFLNNGFRENISGQYYNLVSQADIGTAPNEIPLNQYLGDLAYQDAANIAGNLRAGSINDTPIGATTASTGAFTTLNTSGAVVFNDAGADVDFRVEGDTDANLLFVDASADAIGIGTASPNASALLDVQSTTKGVRMPNMTTTQKNAIVSPAAGLMVFDTTLAKLSVYSGVAWETITSL